ncbi:DUF835 domain-containing protein [Candidatus Woesearchaeota archaeon]|nr:DUF835 domain-containing protein [Candidatus Woesearchaeota archaeon]
MFKSGESYLIIEKNDEKVLSLFSSTLSGDKKGMVVWRVHPQKEKEYFKGKNVTTKWVTNISTKEDHLSPHDLEQLSYDIECFMRNSFGGVILLLCVEYLISFNTFQDILHLVQTAHDFAAEYGCVLIVHVNEGTLDKQQESLLKQELTLVGDINGKD